MGALLWIWVPDPSLVLVLEGDQSLLWEDVLRQGPP